MIWMSLVDLADLLAVVGLEVGRRVEGGGLGATRRVNCVHCLVAVCLIEA